MQKEMAGNPPKVFGGNQMGCNKHMLDFVNCCSSMGGWGKDLGLGKCSNNEKALAAMRAKNLCHYIGSFCAEKVLGRCIRRKQTFCCFESRLSRIFHEQGRPQIGKGWGSAEYPNCEAFTIDELGKMDFGKIDLGEILGEIFNKLPQSMQKSVPQNIENKMRQIQQRSKEPENFEGQAEKKLDGEL
jgi:conjugal transfer mating pair stabilization protein TraN